MGKREVNIDKSKIGLSSDRVGDDLTPSRGEDNFSVGGRSKVSDLTTKQAAELEMIFNGPVDVASRFVRPRDADDDEAISADLDIRTGKGGAQGGGK